MKESQSHVLKTNFFYRCRPTLFETAVIGGYLADLQGTNLQLFNIKDFSLFKTFEVLEKEDQYSAKISIIDDRVLVIFGTEKFVIVDVEEQKVIEVAKVDGFIEAAEVWKNFIVILITDEDSESKLCLTWKFDSETLCLSKIAKSTPFIVPQFEECSEENLKISIIISVNLDPKVYIYWKNTFHMIEVDPVNQLSERYTRNSEITYVLDLNSETYAEILDNKIHVHEKKGGKRIAQLMNEGEVFEKIFPSKNPGELFSLSNLGVKCWKLQMNATPTFYAGSEKQKIQKLFMTQGVIIGINSETNNIVTWQKHDQCQKNLFPNEIIRTMLKLNETQVIFLLEATASSQDENEYHVEKHNKLQIYDFEKDTEIAKKAMNQAKFSIQTDSIVVCQNETIRFIVKEEDEENGEKKYILRWTPFFKDENQKDTKKKEIKGAKNFNSLKLYPFNRILGIIKGKQSESYSLFGKAESAKTQIVLYDFSAKKFGDYDLQGDIFNVEISNSDSIYAIGRDRISIFKIGHKNQLEKVNQLTILSTSLVKPINNLLLIKKQSAFMLCDEDFNLLMNEEVEEEDSQFKVLPCNDGNFILKTGKLVQFWDVKNEDVKRLPDVECQAQLTQMMDGKLICADKWIRAYDLNLD